MNKIAVLGLGKVGALAAQLLHDAKFQVTGFDMREANENFDFVSKVVDLCSIESMRTEFEKVDAVLSCLPFNLNIEVSKLAHDTGIHYFDLTEDVATTNAIIDLGKTSHGVMAPQCGLAPGFVGIVGASLISKLSECRSCRMRVGALPQNPTGLLGF
jgi:saccharopine dehydrogenase-like NADP-dependent oxidoreductase